LLSRKKLLKNYIEKCPFPIGRLLAQIPFSLRLGREYSRFSELAATSENWDDVELNRYLLPRLRAVVEYARDNFPFYRELYREHGVDKLEIAEIGDFASLPVVTKAMIRDHFAEFSGTYKLNTGGTTGTPKGALLSNGALMRGTQNGGYGLGKAFYHRYYAMIPFIHVFGLVRNLLTACYTGSLLYLCANMKAFMKDLPAAKPDTMVLVPALAELLYTIASAYGMGALGGNLRYIICGGAPVSPELIAKFDKLGVSVCPGYGLTETANLVSGNGDFLTHSTSVGMPYPNQELKLVDGELWIKGDNLFNCYYNDPAQTAAAFDDGWFKTGDLAKFDEDGRLYIVGRTKNLIILDNGENVSPEELEALVDEIPFVRDCLVYEDKNDFGAQVIAVEVLPHENTGISDVEAAFKAALVEINRKLPRYMQIDKVAIRTTDFARSGSMKIIRKAK